MFTTGNVKIEWLEDTRAILLEDVIYEDDKVYRVPAGYVTDGASVPRALSWLYPKYGAYLKAAIVHDYLITDILPTNTITSARVDKIFQEAMRDLGIPKIRQWAMWAGVRWGALFNKKRRKGSLKTLPKVLLISLILLPIVFTPTISISLRLGLFWLISLFLPKKQKITAHKT
jgi:hypothetical protein